MLMKTSKTVKRARICLSTLIAAAFVASLGAQGAEAAKDNKKRPEAIMKLCQKLGIGEGHTIADIGCGGGVDTFTFASIVGARGTVYAEEITTKSIEGLLKKSIEQKLDNIVPILGHTEDPRLPHGSVDLAYMHFVFHHFSRPGDMLRHLWLDLKPGGRLVIVDREKGPLKNWVEVETREQKHNWTGETTVVRLARETGFLFEDALEEIWFEKEPFVLVFRKPLKLGELGVEPDPPRALNQTTFFNSLPLPSGENRLVAFCGLDSSRLLLPALREKLNPSTRLFELVLEEWAVTTNEIPEHATASGAEILRTRNGSLQLPTATTLNLVVFADSYHRLWEPGKLLSDLRRALPKDGFLAVMDREGPKKEPRRFANHQRRIAPDLVVEDLTKAGFVLVKKLRAPASDRFFLLFGPDGT